jgi:small-conductance mechanosensitive channel/CRP-like cAMP-binding protein
MATISNILIALGLVVLLLGLRLICRRCRIAPIPVQLPALAILLWLIISSLPSALVSPSSRPWLQSTLQLSQGYALLQLITWAGLELPGFLPWWPRPAKILRDLAMLVIAGAITIAVLQQQARINVVGLVTTSAILTAVIGLAAQESLKDLFAGIVLQVDSPFQEGDYIDVGDNVNGRVVSLTLMSTRVRHVHGALITLPNSRIWGTNIRRFSARGPIAREIHLNLATSFPPEKAIQLLLHLARQHPLVLRHPEPEAFVFAYADHAITYELEVWQEDPTDSGFDVLRGQLLSQIWYALERVGMTLPHPIRELRSQSLPEAVDDPAGVDLASRLNLLRENILFGHLSADQLDQVAPLTRCIRFAQGEAVIVEGEAGDTMFQVVSGALEVQKLIDGKLTVVAKLGPGAIFGEMSVFNNEPRSATVRVQQECVLLEVERDDLRPVLEGNPQLVEQLAKLISERRAQLSDLNQERQQAQGNQLLLQMRQMFSILTSN